jgi:hypothetical protein
MTGQAAFLILLPTSNSAGLRHPSLPCSMVPLCQAMSSTMARRPAAPVGQGAGYRRARLSARREPFGKAIVPALAGPPNK